jgi:RHS repeat-associated protein
MALMHLHAARMTARQSASGGLLLLEEQDRDLWEDAETGLFHVRARSYGPNVGAWLQRDRLGLGAGDVNLYRFTNNDPVNFTDPTGDTPCAVAELESEAMEEQGDATGTSIWRNFPRIVPNIDFDIRPNPNPIPRVSVAPVAGLSLEFNDLTSYSFDQVSNALVRNWTNLAQNTPQGFPGTVQAGIPLPAGALLSTFGSTAWQLLGVQTSIDLSLRNAPAAALVGTGLATGYHYLGRFIQPNTGQIGTGSRTVFRDDALDLTVRLGSFIGHGDGRSGHPSGYFAGPNLNITFGGVNIQLSGYVQNLANFQDALRVGTTPRWSDLGGRFGFSVQVRY